MRWLVEHVRYGRHSLSHMTLIYRRSQTVVFTGRYDFRMQTFRLPLLDREAETG